MKAIREMVASGAIPVEAAASILGDLAPGKTEGQPASKGRDDYQSAFQKLVDLGLPDASGAKYVKLTFAQADEESQMFYSRYTLERAGNAWLLPSKDPKSRTRTVIHDGVQTTKIASKEKRNLIVRLFAGADDRDRDGLRKAEWTEVDPEKEIDAIIKRLEEDPELSPLFDRERWSYDSESMTLLGDLLVTACHVYRAGHPDAGNKLARHLLTRAPYPFRVIDFAVSKLANHEYQSLLTALYEKQDWKAFLTGIRELRVKFPRGWDLGPGLGILIPQVADFRAKGPLALEPYQNVPLDPEIVAALNGILKPAEPGTAIETYTPACWVINPRGELRSEYGPSGPPSEWLAETVAKGMDALPTLVAASADPTLIPAPYEDPGSSSYGGFTSYSSGNESPDEAAFKTMPRPTSRGAIARAILLRTLPAGSVPWSSLAPEDFQIAAHQWWSENKDLTPSELAILFLREGDSEQSGLALKALLKTKDPKSFEIIEEHILASDSIMSSVDLVQQYLRVRRGEGKKFYESFMAAFEAEISESFQGVTGEEYQQYIEQTKKSLSVLVDEVSPEKLMAEMTAGKRPVEEGFSMLQVALGEDDFRSKHDLLVPFIVELPETADRLFALKTLQEWTMRAMTPEEYNLAENGELNEAQKKARQQALANREHWMTLLGRKDSLALDPEILMSYENPPSEAHYAASVMNALYFGDSFSALNALNQVAATKELWPLFLIRMKAFLETEQAPPLPSAAEVEPARRKELLTKVTGMETSDIIPWRNSLPLSERLALTEAIASLETTPENLTALSRICQKIDWNFSRDFPAALRPEIESLILYQEISPEFIDSLRDFLSEQEEDMIFYFMVNRPQKNGPRILVGGEEMAEQWVAEMLREDLAKLDGQEHDSLVALIAFGVGDENDRAAGTPETAILHDKPFDSAKEKQAFDVLVKKALPLFEPSDDEDGPYFQRGFALSSFHFQETDNADDSDSE